jgi:ubiquinone/menaquinone biosynthesis C-methylase UbiE
MSDEIIQHYTEAQDEENRLARGIGQWEFLRTLAILSPYLGRPQTVVDVGGGTGVYALWLAGHGHDVHVVDLVPHHVQLLQEKARARSLVLGSASVGDALSLSFPDQFADLVLLMGPLYHMTKEDHRLKALRECARIVKPGGRVLCSVISRFASMLAGFRNGRFDDPEFERVVDGALRDGQHRNPLRRSSHLGSAFFHRPSDLRGEMERAGLVCEKIAGIETPIAIIKQLDDWVDNKGRMYELARKYALLVEEDEALLGASFHLLGVGRRP